ncbi:MAG: DUF3810 domain-containing protein [Clostridiales bacterium]|nr:DUF3810 domain-containing protein [Clostridiales bacterium]
MKLSEKIISAVVTIVAGVLLLVMKSEVISILMTVAGISLIVLGVLDIFRGLIPPAVVKIVVGALIILCGWVIVEVVLYIVAAILLIVGILMLYDKIKKKIYCKNLFHTICEYAMPALFILIGFMFLFHQGKAMNFIFIVSGILTILEGGVLLVNALSED